jgi:hypothetical protein
MDDELIAYRIVEIKDGKILSLFHGTNGSRTIPWNIWVKADKKEVRDGSGKHTYLSGFHFLMNKDRAEEFFSKRFKIKNNRKIVMCHVRGNIRIKNENAKPLCYLADEIKFVKSEIML